MTESVLIVGGGTAGWMTALYMSHKLPQKTEIRLVESSDIGIIGVGEGSTPYMKNFFDELGIAESEWMQATDATYKSGIRFENWCAEPQYNAYFHPFFNEFDIQPAEMFFYNSGLKRRGFKADAKPDHYFTASYIAEQYRNPKPIKAINKHVDYAYHFDSVKLARFLRDKAIGQGVKHIVANISHAQLKSGPSDTEQGIDKVITDQGEELTADFFVDCTGFRSLLIQDALKQPFQSYNDWLFNDSAVAIQTPLDQQGYKSQTNSKALTCGWMWQIPLTSRWGNGYVYSSQYLSPQDAEAELRSELKLEEATDIKVKHLKMKVGRIDNHWHKNCVAIGLSQGFIEPLEATALMLVQFAIQNFTAILSKTGSRITSYQQADIEAYNIEMNRLFEGVKDYITLHYLLNTRQDSQYWIDAREKTKVSHRLKTLLDAWDQGKDFEVALNAIHEQLVYLRPSWYCILSGMGRHPEKLLDTDKQAPTEQATAWCNQTVQQYFPLISEPS